MILNDSLTFNVESFRTMYPVFEGQKKRTERELDNLLHTTYKNSSIGKAKYLRRCFYIYVLQTNNWEITFLEPLVDERHFAKGKN